MNAQLFYKDSTNIIYSLFDNQVGRYFLNIPVSQYTNFMLFLKLKTEDNTKKGTSEYSNEKLKRKQLLEEVIKVNDFIKTLNTNMVYSRINHLKELPIKELEDILNENKPFDINKYKEITKKIEDTINENFKLMTNSNIKKESIEQTILLISQKENDKDFIKWLKNNLTQEYSQKNLEDLKLEYKKQNIQLNIEEFKEIKNNDKKYIIGKNSKGEIYNVEFPSQYNMLEVFEMELKTIDKSKLVNLDSKIVATILFDKIILDLPSERMVKKSDEELNKEENKIEQNILNNQINNEEDNYLIDKTNNIAINTNNNDNVITIEKNDDGKIVANDSQVSTYEFDQNTQQPKQTETIIQNKGKRRILVPSKNDNTGFIKIGTIVLFGLSFILTIISLVLLITS